MRSCKREHTVAAMHRSLFEDQGEDEASKIDENESKAMDEILKTVGENVLPQNMSEELLGTMAPAGLFPDQMHLVLDEMYERTPYQMNVLVRLCTDARPCQVGRSGAPLCR